VAGGGAIAYPVASVVIDAPSGRSCVSVKQCGDIRATT